MVTREDFRSILTNEELLNKIVRVTMMEIDKNMNGYLDLSTLGSLMQHVATEAGDKRPCSEDIESVFSSLDKDSDGKIDFNEFKELIIMVLNHALDSDIIQEI